MVILTISLWTFRLPSYKTLYSVRSWYEASEAFACVCLPARGGPLSPARLAPSSPFCSLHYLPPPSPVPPVSTTPTPCVLLHALLQCSSSSYQFSEAGPCLQHPVIEPSRPRSAGPLLHVSRGGALCRLGYVHAGNQVFSLQCQHGGDQSTVPSAPLLLHSTYGSN